MAFRPESTSQMPPRTFSVEWELLQLSHQPLKLTPSKRGLKPSPSGAKGRESVPGWDWQLVLLPGGIGPGWVRAGMHSNPEVAQAIRNFKRIFIGIPSGRRKFPRPIG